MQHYSESAQRSDSAYEAGLPPASAREAIIIGGGVAGLLAAHVACQHGFHRVTLLDRDLLGGKVQQETVQESAARRPGVPQLCHPHALMMGGIKAFDQLLPGFTRQLIEAGGKLHDLSQDNYGFDFGLDNSSSRGPCDYKFIAISRRLLEQLLRERVIAENPGKLVVMGGSKVAGLVWSQDGGAVTGVRLGSGTVMPATLVIDASGRYSSLPLWLEEANWGRPAVKKVDAQLCYTSCTVQLPEQPVALKGDPIPDGACNKARRQSGILTLGRPALRGGIMTAIEGNLATVLLYGYSGDKAPMDEKGFLQYAASLNDPEKALYKVLSVSKPVSPITRYAGLKTALRCYHEMAMPRGLLVVGDSVVELDPLLAMGMTVTAVGCQVLNSALGETFPAVRLGKAGSACKAGNAQQRLDDVQGLRQLASTFQKRYFKAVSLPWDMHSSEDMRYPGAKIEGVSKPPRILSLYFDYVAKAAVRDRFMLATMFSVASMLKPPTAMFAPAMAWGAAKEAARDVWSLVAGLLTRA
ncbi:hypothetical protein N2152v2_000152 [Parachlorella kessleri]